MPWRIATLGCIAIILLSGGTSLHGQALAFFLVGGLLMWHPPQRGLGRVADGLVAALLAWLALSFVPIGSLGAVGVWFNATLRPQWWTDAAALGVNLPATLTPQPWVSLENFALILCGLGFMYALVGLGVPRSARGAVLLRLCMLLGALGLYATIGAALNLVYPLATQSEVVFSFFPNRNQTALVLAVGSVLGLGLGFKWLRKRPISGAIALSSGAFCTFGVALNGSRAGLVLWFVGACLWAIGALRRSQLRWVACTVLPILLAGWVFVTLSNHPSAVRLAAWLAGEGSQYDNFRLNVYADALVALLENGLWGVGLGNFRFIFPQYVQASFSDRSVLHPESDILWWGIETGVIGLILGGALFVLLLKRVGYGRKGKVSSKRMVASVCVLLCALHMLVDVPGHRVGTVFLMILLWALAQKTREKQSQEDIEAGIDASESAYRRQLMRELEGGATHGLRAALTPRAVLWRLGALCLLSCGGIWLWAAEAGPAGHAPLRTLRQALHVPEASMAHALKRGNTAAFEADFNQVNAHAPLYWKPYYLRAWLQLEHNWNAEAALADFRRARFLHAYAHTFAFEEGTRWLEFDTDAALEAWREALNRARGQKRVQLFRNMLARAQDNFSVLQTLQGWSLESADVRYAYLLTVRGDAFKEAFTQELEDPSRLFAMEPAAQQYLWRAATAAGMHTAIITFFEAHPGYKNNLQNVPAYASALAASGNYEAAVKAMLVLGADIPKPQFGSAEMGPGQRAGTLNALQRAYIASRGDLLTGTRLFTAALEVGDNALARRTAEKLMALPNVPPYVRYAYAKLLAQRSQHSAAWQALAPLTRPARAPVAVQRVGN